MNNMIEIQKSHTLRWAGHLARMKENHTVFIITINTATENIPVNRLVFLKFVCVFCVCKVFNFLKFVGVKCGVGL